jgi:hypothetical protein
VQLRCFKEQVDELCIERAHAPIFPVLVPKKSELSARAPGPQVEGKSGTSFWNRFKIRTRERDTYPIQCYDYDPAIMFPYLLLNNAIGAIAENRLILHTYMRDKHPKGERQIGVNKRVEDGPFGGWVYSCLRVGILYWNPTQSSIKTLVEYDALLDKFKYVPPKKGLSTGNIKSYFQAKSDDVEEIIENNLFPEQLDVVFSHESPDFFNSVLKDCATDDDGNNFTYKPINHENYQNIKKERRARYAKTTKENARKRANGEIIVAQRGPVVKLAASERTKSGVRACNTTNCTKNIQLYDGLGGGYCIACAPASLRSTNHCSVQGCTKRKRYGSKCKAHCDKNNELSHV